MLTAAVLCFLWFYWYRWQNTVAFPRSAEYHRSSIEGYTDSDYYTPDDTITAYIRSTTQYGKAVLRRVTAPYQEKTIDTLSVGRVHQPLNQKQAVSGCDWTPTVRIPVTPQQEPGYYHLRLTNHKDTTYTTFLVGEPQDDPQVAILAPVSTWTAYNPWGGKSLYINSQDSSDVYQVSANRPNPHLNYSRQRTDHSLHVEGHIYNWWDQHYNTALLPDYALENPPQALQQADILVLAYHCEYFSKPMYDNLEQLVYEQQRSLISLGGNQVYNKVQWHGDYDQLECHKDLTLFEDWSWGGSWKHNFRSEAGLLGVRYNPSGLFSYAPYEVQKPDHWVFQGLGVEKGDHFGSKGINCYPLSGYETDQPTWWSRSDVTVLAKGLNPEPRKANLIYDSSKSGQWTGAGGATMTLKSLSDKHAVLATGSIQSGSGLGVDSVMTGVIRNFMKRYGQ